jgi:hypothetical protein
MRPSLVQPLAERAELFPEDVRLRYCARLSSGGAADCAVSASSW